MQLDAAHRGGLTPIAIRYEPRTTRFDVTFEIEREQGQAPTRLRFTGTVIETVETAVVTRSIERGEILKSADVVARAPAESWKPARTRRSATAPSACRCAAVRAPARCCACRTSPRPTSCSATRT